MSAAATNVANATVANATATNVAKGCTPLEGVLADYKPAILDALGIMMKKEQIAKQPFKARAYQKVIKQIQAIDGPIRAREDLVDVKGIGEKIEEKLTELFATGELGSAKRALEAAPIALYDQLLKVHRIGPAKARKLVDAGITSIEDLKTKVAANPKLLDAAQRIGLAHFDDFQERIPREEMLAHDARIHELIDVNITAEIVGSYRRGASTSGDIDVLIMVDEPEDAESQVNEFHYCVEDLKGGGYITDILALGDHKCMAVSKVGDKYRRLDLLLTPKEEMAFAILYFTGSDTFNVAMRSWALELGWSLNEHGFTRVGKPPAAAPPMATEEDIFAFLGLQYVPPTERTGPEKIQPAPIIRIRRKKAVAP